METTMGRPAARSLFASLPRPLLAILLFMVSSRAQGQSSAPSSPLESVSTWTAFNWNGSAWKETVLAKKIVEKYSGDGLLLSSELSLLVGGVHEKTDYVYSGNRLLKMTVRDGTGTLMRTTNYEYDESGGQPRRAATTLSAGGRVVNREIQYFDGEGRMTKAVALDKDGKAALERRFSYDGLGRVIGEYAVAANDSLAWVRSCEYGKADDRGNWIFRTDWENYRGSWAHQRYAIRRELRYAGESAE